MADIRWAAEYFSTHAKVWDQASASLAGEGVDPMGKTVSGWPPMPGRLAETLQALTTGLGTGRAANGEKAGQVAQLLRETGRDYLDTEAANKAEADRLKREFEL